MANGWSGPDPGAQDDGATAYELATRYTANADITVNKVRVWHPASSASVGGRRGRIWSNLGLLIEDGLLSDSLPPGWSEYDLDVPVPVVSGTTFLVSYSTFRYYGAVGGGYPRNSTDNLLTADAGLFGLVQGVVPGTATGSFYGVDINYAAGIGGNLAPAVALSIAQNGMQAIASWTVVDEFPAGVGYLVDWGDGTTTGTVALTASHTYAFPGVYAILVTATDAQGLQSSDAAIAYITELSPTELAINRINTKYFIDARPSVLSLIPTIRTKTGSGGFRLADGVPRAAQVLRVIEQASAYGNNPGLLNAQDGQQRKVTYQLLGEYNAAMEVGDHFLDSNGIRSEIAELLPYNGYERRGRLVTYG